MWRQLQARTNMTELGSSDHTRALVHIPKREVNHPLPPFLKGGVFFISVRYFYGTIFAVYDVSIISNLFFLNLYIPNLTPLDAPFKVRSLIG